MSKPTIHGVFVPASLIGAALGDALSRIRQEDRMTWGALGEVLGKSEDQVAKYADGTATMDVVTFYRGKAAWNGRFTGAADKLVEAARGEADGHHTQSCILKAALELSVALADGELSVAEIRAAAGTLQNARDAVDALLARLTPKAA